MSNFERDIILGNIGEDLVKEIFKNRGYQVRGVKQGYFPGFDMEIQRNDTKGLIEVKFDLKSALTGNIAVEHKALQKSAATHYVYLVVKPYIIKKDKLQWCADSPDFKQVPSGDFGDISSLIPVSYLELSHFKKL